MTKERLQAWGDSFVLPIVGAFVFNEAGELLLLQRHSDDLGGGKWGTPGGRIDVGEDERTAIVREFYEETGIQHEKFFLLGSHVIHMPHGTVLMTSFRTNISNKTTIHLNPDEHHDYQWASPVETLKIKNILWGMPTILRDFNFIEGFDSDPTLADGSYVKHVA